MPIPVTLAEQIMRRALQLAENGLGRVEPNPAVGAVIVDDSGLTLGEGWHQEFGGAHAEIHAIAAAGRKSHGSTLFVTLEPCCHFGKTPPCSKAVIAAGIRHVVVATRDPAPHVNGGGIAELQAAGIQVELGLLEAQAKRLIAPFVQLTKLGRPWFHAKWAMTLDGKIASRSGHSKWITNDSSRALVHQLRGRMDGILIGIGTALADDPMLNSRPSGQRTATRIVLDSAASLPLESRLVRTAREIPVLVFASETATEARLHALRNAGVEVVTIESDEAGRPQLKAIAQELGRRRMTNVLLEGGSKLLGSFHDAGLVDEVHAFIAPKLVGGATAPSPVSGIGHDQIPQGSSLDAPVIQVLDGDIYVHGHVKKH